MEIALPEPQENFLKRVLKSRIEESIQNGRIVSDDEIDEALETRSQELLAQGIPL